MKEYRNEKIQNEPKSEKQTHFPLCVLCAKTQNEPNFTGGWPVGSWKLFSKRTQFPDSTTLQNPELLTLLMMILRTASQPEIKKSTTHLAIITYGRYRGH
jgi:hypothetical protein